MKNIIFFIHSLFLSFLIFSCDVKYSKEERRELLQSFSCDCQLFQYVYYRFPKNQEEYSKFIRKIIPYYIANISKDSVNNHTLIQELENENISKIKEKYGCTSICYEYALLKNNDKLIECYNDSLIIKLNNDMFVLYPKKYTCASIIEEDYRISLFNKEGDYIEISREENDSLLHDIHVYKSKTKSDGVYCPMIIKYTREYGINYLFVPNNVNVDNFKSIKKIEEYLKLFFFKNQEIEEIIIPQKMVW